MTSQGKKMKCPVCGTLFWILFDPKSPYKHMEDLVYCPTQMTFSCQNAVCEEVLP